MPVLDVVQIEGDHDLLFLEGTFLVLLIRQNEDRKSFHLFLLKHQIELLLGHLHSRFIRRIDDVYHCVGVLVVTSPIRAEVRNLTAKKFVRPSPKLGI